MHRPLPVVELVDMRREFQETGQETSLLPRPHRRRPRPRIDRGEQAIILLNRRGYSFAVLCRACGEKLQCENCAISLTYHKPVDSRRDRRSPAGQRLNVTTADTKERCPSAARNATANTCFTSAPARSKAKSACRSYFPTRASAAWTATPSAAASTWSACSCACTAARSTCSSARR